MIALFLAIVLQIATPVPLPVQPDLSTLKIASVKSVQSDKNGIKLTVFIVDANNNAKEWSHYLTDAEAMLWQMDQKAVITLAYQTAAKSLADDIADAQKAIMALQFTDVSPSDASAYTSTAQTELDAAQAAITAAAQPPAPVTPQ